jgi:poly-gamma-glutamate synthesis protein (capsule biosynthesis protein)
LKSVLRSLTILAFLLSSGVLRSQDARTRLMVFGDVSLGRAVGQQILKGNIRYPFEFVADSLRKADIVFVNLESQLSDQNGVTEHPQYNMVFTGPPEGARSLKDANITVVSTANNHAYDFGRRALRETIENLQREGVGFVGTSLDSVTESTPAIVEHAGTTIGFLAYTQFVNSQGAWKGRIAVFERELVRRDIAVLKERVDLVVVSYHAGAEYVDGPSAKLRQEFRYLVECGADIVVGHHPHYPQGIERFNGKLVFYSLGNFVFYQPQREWSRFGLGATFQIAKDSTGAKIGAVQLHAVRAGLRPSFDLTPNEERLFYERLSSLSSVRIVRRDDAWIIDQRDGNE